MALHAGVCLGGYMALHVWVVAEHCMQGCIWVVAQHCMFFGGRGQRERRLVSQQHMGCFLLLSYFAPGVVPFAHLGLSAASCLVFAIGL